jgi:predicted dehydrogenase
MIYMKTGTDFTRNLILKNCLKKKETDMKDKIRVGFVGVARAASFLTAFEENPETAITAFCDVVADNAAKSAEKYEAAVYTDYSRMLDEADIDAVVISTPMQFHAPQSIEAIEKGIHVLSEVTAAVNINEAQDLVKTVHKGKAVYMMGENFCYMKPNVIIREMVRAGLFGEIYFGEGEYLHELKQMNVDTPWRRRWQTGVNGCSYGTHSLGPVLQWFEGQRVVAVSCVGTGHHYKDPEGSEYELEDTIIMLCRMSGGGLVKIRIDMLSDRPHAMTNYALQGSGGAYESSRTFDDADRGLEKKSDEINRVWLKGLSEDSNKWDNLADYEQMYLPERWKNISDAAKKAGHGGGDYFQIGDFVDSIMGRCKCPIGIHEAMDMTLPGLVSQESIAKGGQWLNVPDSREWVK